MLSNKTLHKALSLNIVLCIILSTLTLLSCQSDKNDFPWLKETETIQETLPPKEASPINFEYTLTDSDPDEFYALLKTLEDHIDNKEDSSIVSANNKAEDKFDYIGHQYYVSQINYYSDLDDDDAYDAYVYSEEIYMDAYEEYLYVLKKLYNSELASKNEVFADWTEAEIKSLTVSNKEVIDLEEKQNELIRQYLELGAPELSEEWTIALEKIYLEYIDASQKLASHYGYDYYYDYAANEIYQRQNTKEQRDNFRKIVKEQILPFYIEIDSLYDEKRALLNTEQRTLLSSLRNDTCQPENEYLVRYINSYPEKMQIYMNYLFNRNGLLYSEKSGAHTAAFTGYSYYYDQPFVFLGNDMQDLLTLVHELGHYTAYYHFSDAKLPYETGETHSQGNEWLFLYNLNGKIDQDVYDVFMLRRLRSGLETIIICTLVDEYEEKIFTHGKIDSTEALEDIWIEVFEGYENIEAISTAEELYAYTQQVTIESSVYYLNYATSELVAMTFFTVASEDGYGEAQKIFTDLCLETPVGVSFFETLTDIGLPDPYQPDTFLRTKDAFKAVLEK
ncbi:MAG: hypothetical protein E7615_06325 [Ruminococcaceae bacterium]|nr:hypothetical protein [Oscillospiraceae bacterium]